MSVDTISRFISKELKIRSVSDSSRNGLQVRATKSVHLIGLSADACMEVFRKAKARGCDMVIVHHGLFWKGRKDTAGLVRKRVEFLKKNRISLYAVHLPLDKSRKYGHNTYLFNLIGARPEKLFGYVGYIGTLDRPRGADEIAKELEKKLDTKCSIWKFNGKKIRRIAIVSGAGGSEVVEAIGKKADALVTGEANSSAYHYAKEGRIDVILAGHYKTETNGVVTIGKLLEKRFGVRTTFIDVPTGL